MLNIGKYEINGTDNFDNYESYLETNLPDYNNYISKKDIFNIKEYLSDKCKCIVHEFPYYDKDFLSNYYEHYSLKYDNTDKRSLRLLFFADAECEKLIGYISFYNLKSNTHIGRMFINPKYIVGSKPQLIVSNHKVHLDGLEYFVECFPEIGSIEPYVCGHSAIWGVVRHRGHWYEYSSKTTNEISQYTPFEGNREKYFDGITLKQISKVLYDLGFNPVERFSNLHTSQQQILKEVCVAIDSKMPVILIVNKYNHAVVGVGYDGYFKASQLFQINDIMELDDDYIETLTINKRTSVSLVQAANLTKSIFVNDNNRLPYYCLKQNSYVIEKEATETTTAENNKTEDNETKNYNMKNISAAIFPFYSRVNLNYIDVENLAKEEIVNIGEEIGWIKANSHNKIVMRIFMTSSNTYREYASKKLRFYDYQDLNYHIYNKIKYLELPRFIWAVEISKISEFDDSQVSGLILYDTTSSAKEKNSKLFVLGKNFMQYKNYNKVKKAKFNTSKDNKFNNKPFVLSRFTNNFE